MSTRVALICVAVIAALATAVFSSPFSAAALVRFAVGVEATPAAWSDIGPAPAAANRYKPQGIVEAAGLLLLNSHWADTRSELYVLDPTDASVKRSVPLPKDAVHVVGLGWDGESPWAVDYRNGSSERDRGRKTSMWSRNRSVLSSLATSPKTKTQATQRKTTSRMSA